MHGISSRLQRTFKKALAILEFVGLVKRTIREKDNLLHLALLDSSPRQEPPKHFISPCPRLGGAHSGFDKITMVLACCIINPLSG